MMKHLIILLISLVLAGIARADGTEIFGSQTFGTVVAIPVEGMQEVHVSFIIGTGAAEDNGLEGLAHFAEHRAFVGAWNETGYRGSINAYTSLKTTEFTTITDARDLRYVINFYKAVLQNIAITNDEFENERRRISREIEVASQRPIGRGSLCAVRAVIFLTEPWNNCVLGAQLVIDTITESQVELFQENYYKSENSVLVIMGSFNLEDLGLGMRLEPKWTAVPLPSPVIELNVSEPQLLSDESLIVSYRAINIPKSPTSIDQHALLTLITFLSLERLENAISRNLTGNRYLVRNFSLMVEPLQIDQAIVTITAELERNVAPESAQSAILNSISSLTSTNVTETIMYRDALSQAALEPTNYHRILLAALRNRDAPFSAEQLKNAFASIQIDTVESIEQKIISDEAWSFIPDRLH